MPFKISFSMTWRSWLSHSNIFQITKRNNELTEYPICCLLFGFFFFNQSQNNAVLEPRTERFRGLVGFEAKELKMCPRGQKHPRGLHLRFLQILRHYIQ